MKLFKSAKSKFIIIATLVFALAFSLFANLKFSNLSASADGEVTTVDTEVKNIVFRQVSGGGYIGFELTESDYTVAAETNVTNAVENYVQFVCNYWSKFSSMNSEGATLPQIFIYWNGGAGGNVVGSAFANTFTHRLSLTKISYGFTVTIPAGTLFPSYEYVNAGCVGTPKVYKTVSDKAYYYDGEGFVEISFELAEKRAETEEEIDSTNLNVYHEAEREQVRELINLAKEELSMSFSTFAIESVKAKFYSALDEVMTKDDYVLLANLKSSAKTKIATYFSSLNQADYSEENWDTLLAMQSESDDIIDAITKIYQVAPAVTAIQGKAGVVLRKDGKTDFEMYRSNAKANLENSFDASLYDEEVRALGASLVSDGSTAILSATTYDEVDALEASYISQIKELKEAEKEEEGDVKTSEEPKEKSGWIFAIIGGGVFLVGASVAVVLIILKNKREGVKKDEE